MFWLKIYKDDLNILPPYYEGGQIEKKSEAPEGSKIFLKEKTWQESMDKLDFAEVEEMQ